MQGFHIDINGKSSSIALESGVFGLIFDCRNGEAKIDITGTGKNLLNYIWHKAQLEEGTTISIELKELDIISEPIETIDPRMPDEEKINRQTEQELKMFNELKQELIKEGLITP